MDELGGGSHKAITEGKCFGRNWKKYRNVQGSLKRKVANQRDACRTNMGLLFKAFEDVVSGGPPLIFGEEEFLRMVHDFPNDSQENETKILDYNTAQPKKSKFSKQVKRLIKMHGKNSVLVLQLRVLELFGFSKCVLSSVKISFKINLLDSFFFLFADFMSSSLTWKRGMFMGSKIQKSILTSLKIIARKSWYTTQITFGVKSSMKIISQTATVPCMTWKINSKF